MEVENLGTEDVNVDVDTINDVEDQIHTESEISDIIPEEKEDGGTEYSPDYKFKVRNEEFEFDEKLRPLVTNKDVEDHLRDLYTKSHGIDYLKKGLDEKSNTITELSSGKSQLENEFNSMKEGFVRLGEMSRNDFTSFQKSMEISDDAILKRAEEIIDYRSADNDRRHEIDKIHQDRMSKYHDEDNLSSLQKENQELRRTQHQLAFNQAMSDSGVIEFKTGFEKRMGEGSFNAEVQHYGSFIYNTQKRYISPSEAIGAVMNRYKPFVETVNPVVTSNNTVEGNSTQSNKIPNPIPSLGSGKPVSPTKRRFKSFDEMRKYGEEMHRQELLRQYD